MFNFEDKAIECSIRTKMFVMAKFKESSTNNQNKKLMTDCDLTYAAILIAGRWKILLLAALNKGPLRYGELRNKVEQITERMLTLQLKELESDQLIERMVYPVVPTKVEYKLTEHGKALIPVLLNLSNWGKSVRAIHNQQGIVTTAV